MGGGEKDRFNITLVHTQTHAAYSADVHNHTDGSGQYTITYSVYQSGDYVVHTLFDSYPILTCLNDRPECQLLEGAPSTHKAAVVSVVHTTLRPSMSNAVGREWSMLGLNGDGLHRAIAGVPSSFDIFARDAFFNLRAGASTSLGDNTGSGSGDRFTVRFEYVIGSIVRDEGLSNPTKDVAIDACAEDPVLGPKTCQ